MAGLRYVGGGAFLHGVPAKDLTDEELEAGGWDAKALVASRLYEHVKAATAVPRRAAEDGGE